ncbi:MAG: hypothetical protein ACFFBD_11085 [Candidatus Hodarchaeota archaeon]
MSKKLKNIVGSAVNIAGKTISDVKEQIRHYTSKLAAEPQYHIIRGRLGATYVIATCTRCGKNTGKAAVSDQAFKAGSTEARNKALAFLIKCESCGLFVGKKCCWGGGGKCQECLMLENGK